MKLGDIFSRRLPPEPWSEGDNIPWNEPGFSRRMLREHLSQSHDLASRRSEKIDAHVDWIHHEVLDSHPTRILDLACGPGLYSSRLAWLGHRCVGIDFSPASIEYARDQAGKERLDCDYIHADVRSAEYGSNFGLAMLIFGEFNVFNPADAARILRKAHDALSESGVLLLEAHTCEAIREFGLRPASWYSAESGLFSDLPHLCLQENFWDAESETVTRRYFIVDASTGKIARYAQSLKAYTEDQYRAVMEDAGFADVRFHPSLVGSEDPTQSGLLVVTARKE
ncbi:MAG: class I SAM-dependent methyltransferase [Chloroflexi bacterium]|nr:class I SAM-dependent methyltransferase [Chloroflexota bacterium]